MALWIALAWLYVFGCATTVMMASVPVFSWRWLWALSWPVIIPLALAQGLFSGLLEIVREAR